MYIMTNLHLDNAVPALVLDARLDARNRPLEALDGGVLVRRVGAASF
jgi:hypothetical protein